MKAIDPELAEKVLDASVANIVKRVAGGSRLTEQERSTLLEALVDKALPEELQKARLAALLRRYASGGVLSRQQEQELAGVIPEGPLVARAVTQGSYLHGQKWYVEKGVVGSLRTLKHWMSRGRSMSPPDLPPLDYPAELAEWYRRVHGRKAPERLERLEGEGGEGMVRPAADESEVDVPQEGKSDEGGEGIPMALELGSDIASDLGLLQIRALVKATFSQLEKAIELKDYRQAGIYRKEWQSLVSTLRQWEKDWVKIQEGKGEVLRTRVINTELVRIFTILNQSFTNVLIGLIEELAPAMPPVERRVKAQGLRDLCFEHLQSTRFSEAWSDARGKEGE